MLPLATYHWHVRRPHGGADALPHCFPQMRHSCLNMQSDLVQPFAPAPRSPLYLSHLMSPLPGVGATFARAVFARAGVFFVAELLALRFDDPPPPSELLPVLCFFAEGGLTPVTRLHWL